MTDNISNSMIETGWNFDNSYARLPDSLFAKQNPTPVRSPKLIIFNDSLAKALGLSSQALQSNDGAEVMAGNRIPEGALPLAQAYAGHQFGHLNKLGDGRAVLLGEQITPTGERVDIQLKGAGRTPYSRSGDGRAALGPMMREYIISEAMHALGIATTRSLAVVETGESLIRETKLPGAILTRVAASHLRVGTYQYASNVDKGQGLRALADYTLQRHFPEVDTDENRYITLLKEVIKRQADLIAKWQLVGFIHGVMNTDNMAISGRPLIMVLAPSWMLMTQQQYSARLILMVVMPMAISRILLCGISRDLLNLCFRCCIPTRPRLFKWLKTRFRNFLSCITVIS